MQAEHTPSLVDICGDSVSILPDTKTLAHQRVHGKDATCNHHHAQSGRYLCLMLQCKTALTGTCCSCVMCKQVCTDASVPGADGVLIAQCYSLQLQRMRFKEQSQPIDMQTYAISNMEGNIHSMECCANL